MLSANYYCTRLLHTQTHSDRGVLIPPFKNARFLDTMTMIPVTYGYARVSKTDDESRNLETQLPELAAHGIRRDLVFTDEASGRTMDRPGWRDLMSGVQPGDTIVVAFLDRFSRNFEEGMAIQADLTRRDVAIREQIDTREGSAAANFFRRAMLAQGAYQVESASERIRMGLDRARASGKRIGRPPALSPDQVGQCRRMAEEGAGLRQIARVLKCSPATVRKALLAENGHLPGPGAAQTWASNGHYLNQLASGHECTIPRVSGWGIAPPVARECTHPAPARRFPSWLPPTE